MKTEFTRTDKLDVILDNQKTIMLALSKLCLIHVHPSNELAHMVNLLTDRYHYTKKILGESFITRW